MLVVPALRLTAFGGFALASADGPLGAAAAQRRPLAVLALLAAAGEAGTSREKILGLLWPDADPERGRRTLTQTLYSLRRATGADELFLGVTDLRLNPAAVECDVLAFDAALRQGRLADAVALYRGPFLDGFQVPGAEEFERWAEGERLRYVHQCADALRELARRAEREGDGEAEIGWRRRLVALDPLDSTATLALVDALGRAGDAAGAQRAARIHEVLVRDQLDLPLAPAIAARLDAILAEQQSARLRPSADGVPAVPPTPRSPRTGGVGAAGAPGGSAVRTRGEPRPESAGASDTAAPHADSTPVGGRDPGDDGRDTVPAHGEPDAVRGGGGAGGGVAAARPARRRTRRNALRILGGSIAAAALVALGVLVGRRGQPAASPRAEAPIARGAIAVLPFVLETADPGLAFLRLGAADLVTRMLEGGLGPRVVDPGTLLAVLDSAPVPVAARPGTPAAYAHARAVGRRAGAGEVLVGRVGGSPQRLVLSAVLLDVASGAERATAQVSGPADSLSTLVDALTIRLAAGRTMDRERASVFAGAPLPVLSAYLRAEAAYHADRYQEAVALYERALARDTAFAPAALGLALAADRLNSAEQHDRGLALAWAARDRLGERDRAYLLALAGPRYPEPSPAAEHLAAWEEVVSLSPDRAAAWSELGERFFYDGALLGIRNAEARAASAFRRALELDPDDVSARRHLIELAVRSGDRRTLREIASPERIRAIGGDLTGYLLWRVALATDDTAALTRVRARIPSLGVPSLRAIALAAQHDGVAPDDGARALRYLGVRAALGFEQLDVLLGRHSLALNQGRPVVALDVTEQIQDAQPGSRAHLRLRVLDALYAEGDTAAAGEAATELARVADEPPSSGEVDRATRLADACVLAQWHAAPWRARSAGTGGSPVEHARARRAVVLMRGAPLPRVVVPVAAAPRACAELVDAMLAVSTRARNARARVERLDALMLTGPALSDASAWATLAVAYLYEALGEQRRALSVARQRPYLKGWPRYLATSFRTEARLARAVGDTVTAAAADDRYLALRSRRDNP